MPDLLFLSLLYSDHCKLLHVFEEEFADFELVGVDCPVQGRLACLVGAAVEQKILQVTTLISNISKDFRVPS